MHKLQTKQYVMAQSIFAELAEFNLSVDAVLAGTAPGEVWVDDVNAPHLGFMITPEGHYLAGDFELENSYVVLKETIPLNAYLIFHPESWAAVLDRVWMNRFARKHPRQHLRFRQQRLPNWRDPALDGFQLVPVDQTLLNRTGLKNHVRIADWVGGWHSTAYFLQHGFGFCLLHNDTVASWCVANCVQGHKCEIGVVTDNRYRRRGLATIVVAAAVDYCLDKGLTHIGWHCLSSNAGSIAVAERVGFAKERDYFAYSSGLPAENATDLTAAEYEAWAQHYENAINDDARYAIDAAEAWALAGNPVRSLGNLQKLLDAGQPFQPWRLAHWNWRFASIRDTSEFKAIVAALRHQDKDGV